MLVQEKLVEGISNFTNLYQTPIKREAADQKKSDGEHPRESFSNIPLGAEGATRRPTHTETPSEREEPPT